MLAFLHDVLENVPTIIASLLLCFFLIKKYKSQLGIETVFDIVKLSVVTTLIQLIGALALGTIEDALFQNSIFVSFQGVFLLGPVLFLIAAKLLQINKVVYLDLAAIISPLTLLAARMNCMRTGCCGGISFFGSAWSWPVRQAEMLACFIIAMAVMRNVNQNRSPGLGFPFLMMAHGAYRFIAETFVNTTDVFYVFHPVHFWSLLSFVIGCTLYWEMRSRATTKHLPVKKQRRAS